MGSMLKPVWEPDTGTGTRFREDRIRAVWASGLIGVKQTNSYNTYMWKWLEQPPLALWCCGVCEGSSETEYLEYL